MNERVQLTSKLWSIEFSRALLDATQNELLLQNGICFEVAADKRREISNDHNPEVSCTISFIYCALDFFKTRKKLKKWPEDVDFGSIWNARHRSSSISVSVARLSIAEAAPPAEQLLEERNSAPPKRVTLP